MNQENYTNIYGNNRSRGVKTDFDFSGIEIVKINDKEYIKYVDPDTNEVAMMEKISKDSLQLQFEKIAMENNIRMGSDPKENTNNIIRFMKKNISRQMDFIKLSELVNNEEEYKMQLNSLNIEKARVYRYLIQNYKQLHIEKINFETMTALNDKNQIIEAQIDIMTNQINVWNSETTKMEYNNQERFSTNSNKEINISKEQLEVEYNNDKYLELTDMELETLLDQRQRVGLIDNNERMYIKEIIEQRKKQNNQLQNSTQKQYVFTMDDRKAGFLNTALFPGIIVVLGIMIIISLIIIGTM